MRSCPSGAIWSSRVRPARRRSRLWPRNGRWRWPTSRAGVAPLRAISYLLRCSTASSPSLVARATAGVPSTLLRQSACSSQRSSRATREPRRTQSSPRSRPTCSAHALPPWWRTAIRAETSRSTRWTTSARSRRAISSRSGPDRDRNGKASANPSRLGCGPMLTIHFVRHGDTAQAAEGIFCGDLDPPLTDGGRAQAERVARAAAPLGLSALYSSPKLRALMTAEPIARACGLRPVIEDGLREIAYGAWEGRTESEVRGTDPEAYDAWHADP